LGPLYCVSLLNAAGEVVVSFGSVDPRPRSGRRIAIPDSTSALLIEIDGRAIEIADRVLHDLASPFESAETPLGALTHLDEALTHLIAQGEAALQKRLGDMTRAEKQQLVRFLDERGAFSLRKGVERVAAILGVSRFTVYNYLDSARTSEPAR
jgi:predicted transcriptional regulator YheO